MPNNVAASPRRPFTSRKQSIITCASRCRKSSPREGLSTSCGASRSSCVAVVCFDGNTPTVNSELEVMVSNCKSVVSIIVPDCKIRARWIRLSNSRTFPGQEQLSSDDSAAVLNCTSARPVLRICWRRKYLANGKISPGRLCRVGMCRGNTLSR